MFPATFLPAVRHPGPMASDSIVTAAPSAWRTMETALRGLSTTVLVVAVLTAILVIVSLLSILRGNVDLSFLLAIAVFLDMRNVLAFSRGAMDRMRQLGELVCARSSRGRGQVAVSAVHLARHRLPPDDGAVLLLQP